METLVETLETQWKHNPIAKAQLLHRSESARWNQGSTIPPKILSKEYFTYYIILSILLGSKILVRATLAARTPVSV